MYSLSQIKTSPQEYELAKCTLTCTNACKYMQSGNVQIIGYDSDLFSINIFFLTSEGKLADSRGI